MNKNRLKNKNFFITGGLGFIGTNLCEYLCKKFPKSKITVYDNFCMSHGIKERIKILKQYKNLKILKGRIEDFKKLNKSIKNHDIIFHLASNADISAAAENPSIDFYQGVFLTKNILEAARKNQIKEIYFTSGSGVYGENKNTIFSEDKEIYHPVSPYGANKLSSESLISAYCHMFKMKGVSFRLANVIGPLQTHGVIFDFFKKMKIDKFKLKVLGNGYQKKSYIHVKDVIEGIIYVVSKNKKTYDTFNISNNDSQTVRSIANQCVNNFQKKNNLKHKHKIIYEKQLRGWNGDVPIIKLNNKKILKFGWKFKFTSKSSVKETIKYFCSI